MGQTIKRDHFERLETRRMLAAAVNTWSITGSDAGNAITISFRQSDARLLASVDGEIVSTRKLRGLGLLEINAGAGNDVVTINLDKPTKDLQIWINGGTGRDRIFGGAGDEMILGGSDRDVIDGGAGNDTLRGGTDRDELYGSDGNDYVQGNAGYDTLAGGWGDDKLTGGFGNDQLRGGHDEDRLYGGKDADTIKGGADADMLDGGGAANALFNEPSDQAVVGTFDTTTRDDGDGPLTRIETDAELRRWLIEAAIEQWKWSFGNPVGGGVWTYGAGTVLYSSSARGLTDQVAATADSSDHSGTNTQEQGVDEADLVETDGESIFLLNGNDLIIADAAPASDLHQLSRTNVGGSPQGMYLTGTRLTVVTQTSYPIIDWGFTDVAVNGSFIRPIAPSKPQATVIVYDVSDPAAPSIVSKTVLDGFAQDSRVIDGRLYLVMQNYMSAPAPKTAKNDKGEDVYESESAYRAHLEDGLIDEMIPKYKTGPTGAEKSGALIEAPDVYVRDGSRLDAGSVVLINLNDETPAPIDSTSVVGASGQVYASPTSMYLTGFSWSSDGKSDIFKFGLGATQVTLEASGEFEGRVLNQFSMDEEGQYFRLATTSSWGAGAASSVSVFDQVGDDLNVIGTVGGLGVGEQIQSARFIGDKAYLTTFRQIDPLYTIDLANPAHPSVAGELKIPGFSNYLHPAGDGLLIGLGRDANEQGQALGLQLSLFDVSDAAHPKRVGTYDFPDDGGFSGSAATFDPHAFAYFEERGVLAIPVYRNTDGKSEQSTQVLKVDPAKGFTLLGEVQHDGEVRRSVRIGNDLYSIGSDAVNVVDLTNVSTVIAHLDLPPLSTDPVEGIVIQPG